MKEEVASFSGPGRLPVSPVSVEEWLKPWASSGTPAYCRDLDGIVLGSNPAFDRKFGRVGEPMQGKTTATLIHPEDRWAGSQRAGHSGRLPLESIRSQRWRTSQGWRWYSWEEAILQDEEGNPLAIRAIGHDITRQRLAEELYLKLSRAVDQSPVGIAITDASGRIQYVNPKFVQATGDSLEDILDRNVEVLRQGHADEESYRQFWATIRAGGEWRGELSRSRPDGTTVWESVHVSCMRNAGGEITNLLCLREDITERRRLQDELRQAQKMESLGTLAGGIAHDFNNLLAVINGYAEISVSAPDNQALLQKSLREITRAVQRAAGLVRQILTFSRKAETNFSPLDLNQLIRDLAALLSETFPRMVNFALDLEAGLPSFLADHNQLQQVVLNLCVNARDAMPNGGVISINTRVCPGTVLTSVRADRSRQYVCIQVGDTGTGMTPEVRARIFEPFYTTKGPNKGTGLGLAVVYGIVAGHQGYIEVDSTVGVGSTFRIYLPLSEGTPLAPVPAVQAGFPRGTESILIVDDEDPLRRLLKIALTGKGYEVTCATNGLEAIDLIADRSRAFDLVLLDLNMPGATGLEVLKAIRAIRPGLKVLVLSGHLPPEARAEIEGPGPQAFMGKPYNLNDLGRRLRELLEKPS